MFTSRNEKHGQKNAGFVYLTTDPGFAATLSKFFLRSRLSYYRLAEESFVDAAYIHRLVNGDRMQLSPNTIIRLALALKLSVLESDELLLERAMRRRSPFRVAVTEHRSNGSGP